MLTCCGMFCQVPCGEMTCSLKRSGDFFEPWKQGRQAFAPGARRDRAGSWCLILRTCGLCPGGLAPGGGTEVGVPGRCPSFPALTLCLSVLVLGGGAAGSPRLALSDGRGSRAELRHGVGFLRGGGHVGSVHLTLRKMRCSMTRILLAFADFQSQGSCTLRSVSRKAVLPGWAAPLRILTAFRKAGPGDGAPGWWLSRTICSPRLVGPPPWGPSDKSRTAWSPGGFWKT